MAHIHKRQNQRDISSLVGKISPDKLAPAFLFGFCDLGVAVARQIDKINVFQSVKVNGLGFSGTADTLASDFLPNILFISDDFPTFDRPANTISRLSGAGICLKVPYEAQNSAFRNSIKSCSNQFIRFFIYCGIDGAVRFRVTDERAA